MVPIYFSTVNLLEYTGEFDYKQKVGLMKLFISEYNEHSNDSKLMFSSFEIGYLNSLIFRAFAFSSAWSDPNRVNWRDKREKMLYKAVEAIDIISKYHTNYFKKNKAEYELLQQNIIQVINR